MESIEAAGDTDTLVVAGTAGDVMLVHVVSADGGLKPVVELLDPLGAQIATGPTGGSAGTNWYAIIAGESLSMTGNYSIVVSDESGTGTGQYGVSVQRANEAVNATATSLGSTASGSSTSPAELQAFSFDAQAGAALLVRMAADVASWYYVTDPAGAIVTTGGWAGNDVVGQPLATSGSYSLIVYSLLAGGSSYDMFVELINDPAGATVATYGMNHAGSIAGAVEHDVYTFTAAAGDRVLVQSMSSAGSLKPRLELFDAAGSLISTGVSGGSGGTNWYSLISGALLPTSGQYTMLVSAADGLASGDYGLSLQRLNGPSGTTPAVPGDVASDSLTALAQLETYSFDAQAGDALLARMSADVATWYFVADPDGAIMASGGWAGNDVVGQVLPSTGTYTIVVYGVLAAGSHFDLFLDQVNDPGAASPVAFGDRTSASIGDTLEHDAYTFPASAGDRITIQTMSTDGSVKPRFELFDPDGARLLVSSIGGTAGSNWYSIVSGESLTGSGDYTIYVSDADGIGTGSYGIAINRTNESAAAAALSFGMAASDSLTELAQLNAYSFAASADDELLIRMAANTNTWFHLFGPDGSQVASGGWDGNEVAGATLVETGSYSLIVFGVFATGSDYSLFVQRLNAPGATTALSYGDHANAALANAADHGTYHFDAEPGDVVVIHAMSHEPGLQPVLELYDPDGELVFSVEPNLHSTDAWKYSRILDPTIAQSGTHTILVRDHALSTGGTYGLALDRSREPGSATNLSYGTDLSGSIAIVGEMDTFTFEGQVGDQVTLTVSPEFASWIYYFGPGGAMIDEYALASLGEQVIVDTLGATGEYTVMVFGNTTAGSGVAYDLSLTAIPGSGYVNLWADLTGREQIRYGLPSTYGLHVGNAGTTAVDSIIVLLSFPLGYDVQVNHPLPRDTLGIAWTDFPEGIEGDSLVWVPIEIFRLEPGESSVVGLTVTAGPAPSAARKVGLDQISGRGAYYTVLDEAQSSSYKQTYGQLRDDEIEVSEDVEDILATLGASRVQYRAGIKELEGKVKSGLLGIPTHMVGGGALAGALVVLGAPASGAISVALAVVGAVSFVAQVVDLVQFWDDAGSLKGGKPLEEVGSWDPNDKISLAGSGAAYHIRDVETLPYTVFFENLDSATAPAQTVVVTDTLDTASLDLSTFSLGPITFGDQMVVPPQGLTSYATQVDLRPDNDLLVDIEATLEMPAGVVAWSFTSIDPVTGLPTTDPLAGFLPPNAVPPEGEGSLDFTISPLDDLPTGHVIANDASIVFDFNPAIQTPTWINTIDVTRPSSSVHALPATQGTVFGVSWSGVDTGAGVRDYTVYVSEDGGPFEPWLADTPDTSATFSGITDVTYSFYTVARDSVGNVEWIPNSADASTTADVALSVELEHFAAAVDGKDVLLTWRTASERQNAGYEVEYRPLSRETDSPNHAGTEDSAVQWQTMGFVAGSGTTSESNEYTIRGSLAFGEYVFRLRILNVDGRSTFSPEIEVAVGLQSEYHVGTLYPNPFDRRSSLRIAVRDRQEVTVRVFDVLGRHVRTVFDGEVEANQFHELQIDGANLASGLLLIRVEGRSFAEVRTVVLAK